MPRSRMKRIPDACSLAERLPCARRLSVLVVLIGALSQATPARAEPPSGPRPWRLVVATGYDVGVSAGPVVSVAGGGRQQLDANGGLWIAAGGLLAFGPDRRYELQASIGLKGNSAGTGTSGLTYRAVPLEVLAARAWSGWRLAAGVSYAIGPTYQGAGASGYLSQDLRNALGLVGQAELLGGSPGDALRSAIGLRVTWQTLLAEDGTGTPASAVGFTAGLSF